MSELLERILALELDEPGAMLPFTSRLAREQGWTHVFAGRVVEEYKRFIALAMLAGHPVTPSEEVDQVWHLHMVYTKSYWHDLCRDVLGRDLHHTPTTGGGDEGTKFEDWYGKTLESYRRIFKAEPPVDIWLSVEDRFANAGAGRWVDSAKFWLVPKPRFLSYFRK
ncbi:MAG: glycine-rich domain-containing protein [Luteolibacter sp.]